MGIHYREFLQGMPFSGTEIFAGQIIKNGQTKICAQVTSCMAQIENNNVRANIVPILRSQWSASIETNVGR